MFVDHLLKIRKEFKNLKKYIYRNESDYACFQHDLAYVDCKDLAKKGGFRYTFGK